MCDLLRIAIKAGNRARCYHAVCLVTDLSSEKEREREREREREKERREEEEFTETTSNMVLIRELIALC